MGSGARIAIVTEDDAVWALSGWEQTLLLLAQEGHDVAGIWAVEGKLGPHRGLSILWWYVRHLGVVTTGMLAGFSLLHKIARKCKMRPAGVQALAEQKGISFFKTASPNDAALSAWVREEKIEVLLISVGHILKGDILSAPSAGIINKHAGLLPGNKGLWPYFWAVVEEMKQGVSYHVVNENVDAGALLLQHSDVPQGATGSMIAYYAYVYGLFGQHMTKAVENLLLGQFAAPVGKDAAPRTLPSKEAFARFRGKGGVVMRISDMKLALTLMGEL